MSESTPFGQWLEAMLAERGLSYTAFAEALDVTPRAVDNWRRGSRYPSLLMVARMARVLDVAAGKIVHEAARDAALRQVEQYGKRGT